MSFRLLPKDPKFFELFVARRRQPRGGRDRPPRDGRPVRPARRAGRRASRRLEKRGDEIDEEVTRRLEDAFVTPFDREDIHELVSRLDDVVDGIQSIAEAFVIYGVDDADRRGPPAGGHPRRPGRRARRGPAQARRAQGPRAPPRADPRSSRRRPTACRGRPSPRLFREDLPPIEVIKWRDLYNDLENTIDAAEDAAEAIERMYHKAS